MMRTSSTQSTTSPKLPSTECRFLFTLRSCSGDSIHRLYFFRNSPNGPNSGYKCSTIKKLSNISTSDDGPNGFTYHYFYLTNTSCIATHSIAIIFSLLALTQSAFAISPEETPSENSVVDIDSSQQALTGIDSEISVEDETPLPEVPILRQDFLYEDRLSEFPPELQDAFDKACFTAFWYIAENWDSARDCANPAAARSLRGATQACVLAGNAELTASLQVQARDCLNRLERRPKID